MQSTTSNAVHVTINLTPMDDGVSTWKASCVELPGVYVEGSSRHEAYEEMVNLLDELTSPDRVLH